MMRVRAALLFFLAALTGLHLAYAAPLRLMRRATYAISDQTWYALAIPGMRALSPLLPIAVVLAGLAALAKERREVAAPADTAGSPERRRLLRLRPGVLLMALLGYVAIAASIGAVQLAVWMAALQLDGLTDAGTSPQLGFLAGCLVSVYLGAAVLRFGARFFPLRADGLRDQRSVRLLTAMVVLSVGGILTGLVIIRDLASQQTHLGPNVTLLELLMIGAQVARDIHRNVLQLGVMLVLSLLAPCLWLLVSHLRPRAWARRPFVVFLRRFSGVTNTVGLGVLAKGLPRGYRVAFLVGAADNIGAWDPYAVGVSGLLWTDPLRSVPVCLKATDATWQSDVRRLLQDAAAVVIDTSMSSASMATEIELVRQLGPGAPVLWLEKADGSGSSSLAPANGTARHVRYRMSWTRALPRIVYSSAALLAAGLVVMFLGLMMVARLIGGDDVPWWVAEYRPVFYALAALPLFALRRYVLYPALTRQSVVAIRQSLITLCRGSSSVPAGRRQMVAAAGEIMAAQVTTFAAVIVAMLAADWLRGALADGASGSAAWIPWLGGAAALAASIPHIWSTRSRRPRARSLQLTGFAGGLAVATTAAFAFALQPQPLLIIGEQTTTSSLHGEPPAVWFAYTSTVSAFLINATDDAMQFEGAALALDNLDDDTSTGLPLPVAAAADPPRLGPHDSWALTFTVSSAARRRLSFAWAGGRVESNVSRTGEDESDARAGFLRGLL